MSITYNDQGIPWGPAVHFLEIWNAVARRQQIPIEGICPNWTGEDPIIDPVFPLRRIRVPNLPWLRQAVYDLLVAGILTFCPASTTVYLRLTHFHLFSLLTMYIRRMRPILELNGIMRDDAVSAGRPRWYISAVGAMERAMIRRARVCVAVSEGIRTFAQRIGATRAICIENGVSRRFFAVERRRRANRPIRLLYVGGFTPWDGAERILDLARHAPRLEFIMAGDGGRRDALARTAPPNVSFLGFVPYIALPELYAGVDAGIVLYEELRNNMRISSLKTLEYVAAGLPVFTTDVPGQEFVRENGLGVTSTSTRIERDLDSFIMRIEEYRRNVEAYRHNECPRSWETAAEELIEELGRPRAGSESPMDSR